MKNSPLGLESLFTLNQVDILFSFLFICWNSSPVFTSEMNKFASSANMTFKFRRNVEVTYIN